MTALLINTISYEVVCISCRLPCDLHSGDDSAMLRKSNFPPGGVVCCLHRVLSGISPSGCCVVFLSLPYSKQLHNLKSLKGEVMG